jgi:hypothetical protein
MMDVDVEVIAVEAFLPISLVIGLIDRRGNVSASRMNSPRT